MFIKQIANGNYYLARRISQSGRSSTKGRTKNQQFQYSFLIRAGNNATAGEIATKSQIVFPKEFIGKRVRLKVEIVEDLEEFQEFLEWLWNSKTEDLLK